MRDAAIGTQRKHGGERAGGGAETPTASQPSDGVTTIGRPHGRPTAVDSRDDAGKDGVGGRRGEGKEWRPGGGGREELWLSGKAESRRGKKGAGWGGWRGTGEAPPTPCLLGTVLATDAASAATWRSPCTLQTPLLAPPEGGVVEPGERQTARHDRDGDAPSWTVARPRG